MGQIQAQAEASDGSAWTFVDFEYATLDSWEHKRRIVIKVEWTDGQVNPRYVVTSLD